MNEVFIIIIFFCVVAFGSFSPNNCEIFYLFIFCRTALHQSDQMSKYRSCLVA